MLLLGGSRFCAPVCWAPGTGRTAEVEQRGVEGERRKRGRRYCVEGERETSERERLRWERERRAREREGRE